MSTAAYSLDDLRIARKEVSRDLGHELAAKASDAFCMTVHARKSYAGAAVGMEALAIPSPPTPHIPSVVGFRDALIGEAPAAAEGDDPRARRLLVNGVRNRAYAAMTSVYTEIDRQSHSPLGALPETLRASAAPITQLCWLNRTIRTWADPEVIAEVAADESVTEVDVTRRIMPDAQSPNHAAIGHPAISGLTVDRTGRGVTVGVIDSEVHVQHPALEPRVIPRRNYTAEPWGTPDHHGTAIAGVIGANFQGHMGLAPEVTIYSYKVSATNRWANAFGFDGARAIQDALEDEVDIVNCSWGVGPATDVPSREALAITNAVSIFGLAVVKSAGNLGPELGTLTAPAEAQGVIVVGATDVEGMEVPDYSSRGPAGGKRGPDIVAPGGKPDACLTCCLPNGGFGNAGYGTSYSAPHATGILALLFEEASLEPDAIRREITSKAKLLANWGVDAQGAGLLRVA
ncbi:S8 family serine peptidase [Streptomyces flavidovirens]|uniref:S8 family serine peptidase n=1 Tax=Streptomyces flavidovirens TaxID=67298 RepID=A0ABW6R8E2_9ACTN